MTMARPTVACLSASDTPCRRSSANTTTAVNAERASTPVGTLAPWSKAMRAHRWLALKVTAISISSGMPALGDNFTAMDDVIKILLLAVPCSAYACSYPDEGNMPLRRAVTRIETLPEVDAWAKAVRRDGAVTQVAVMVGESVRRAGH